MIARWPVLALAGFLLLAPMTSLAPRRPPSPTAHLAAAAPDPAPAPPFSLFPGLDLTNPAWLSPWRAALPGYRFQFPRDHAAHPEYRTEWWYYTGHLDAPGGRSFGFELTFFRFGVRPPAMPGRSAWTLRNLHAAHFAVTDEAAGRFMFDERLSRGALGLAGASRDRYRVWVEDWTVSDQLFNYSNHRTNGAANAGPAGRSSGRGGAHVLRAAGQGCGLELHLQSRKPPAIHGTDGLLEKAPGGGPGGTPARGSHYYSLTRLLGEGTLTTPRGRWPVRALAWMDHEFGSDQLAPEQVGWDWFSFQLDDGRELMLYQIRREDGTVEPLSSGTLVEGDGRTRHLRRADFQIAPLDRWRSPLTGGLYPSRWRITVPSAGLTLNVAPTVADQELVTTASTGVAYWEGSVRVSGSTPGRGYVELTGYAEPFRAPI